MVTSSGIPKLPPSGASDRQVAVRTNQLIDRGHFQTTEYAIGVWQDDKPIYRRVVSIGAGPNATTATTAHSISSLGTVTNLWGVLDNGTTQEPAPNGNGTNATAIRATDTDITIETNWNASAYTTFAIIEYTKTTD